MGTVSIRELSRNASGEGELEDMVLTRAPEYLADMAAADEDLAARRTRSATDVFDELDAGPNA